MWKTLIFNHFWKLQRDNFDMHKQWYSTSIQNYSIILIFVHVFHISTILKYQQLTYYKKNLIFNNHLTIDFITEYKFNHSNVFTGSKLNIYAPSHPLWRSKAESFLIIPGLLRREEATVTVTLIYEIQL